MASNLKLLGVDDMKRMTWKADTFFTLKAATIREVMSPEYDVTRFRN